MRLLIKNSKESARRKGPGPHELDSIMRRRPADGKFRHPNASNYCFQVQPTLFINSERQHRNKAGKRFRAFSFDYLPAGRQVVTKCA
jgi:hypothetical protein